MRYSMHEGIFGNGHTGGIWLFRESLMVDISFMEKFKQHVSGSVSICGKSIRKLLL